MVSSRSPGIVSIRPKLVHRSAAFVLALFAVALGACRRPDPLRPPHVGQHPNPVVQTPFPESVTSSRGLPPRVADSTSVLLGDTVVRASVFTEPATATQPMRLNLAVGVADTTIRPIRQRGRVLPLAACPFSLRLYRNADRSTSPAWSSDKTTTALRCPALQQHETSRTDVSATWDVPALLGDSLRAGRYRLDYAVRTADGRTFDFRGSSAYLTADPTPPTRDLSAIEFSATSRIVGNGPRTLNTVTTLKNTGRRSVVFDYGACNVSLRLYHTADRSGSPVWRSERRQPPGTNSGYDCTLEGHTTVLPPGDSITFPVRIPMYEVIADSLAAGRYYVSAELSLEHEIPGSRASRVRTLAAGSVDIRREPDRLPESRIIDGLTYTATTRVVRGAAGADTVRTLVLVANRTNVRRMASVTRDCPVIVFAYRSPPRVVHCVDVRTTIVNDRRRRCRVATTVIDTRLSEPQHAAPRVANSHEAAFESS
jgi:hypothetical protein